MIPHIFGISSVYQRYVIGISLAFYRYIYYNTYKKWIIVGIVFRLQRYCFYLYYIPFCGDDLLKSGVFYYFLAFAAGCDLIYVKDYGDFLKIFVENAPKSEKKT